LGNFEYIKVKFKYNQIKHLESSNNVSIFIAIYHPYNLFKGISLDSVIISNSNLGHKNTICSQVALVYVILTVRFMTFFQI
jgi:hypothetical protein